MADQDDQLNSERDAGSLSYLGQDGAGWIAKARVLLMSRSPLLIILFSLYRRMVTCLERRAGDLGTSASASSFQQRFHQMPRPFQREGCPACFRSGTGVYRQEDRSDELLHL